MFSRTIAFVFIESIERILHRKITHHPITRYLCYNGCSGNVVIIEISIDMIGDADICDSRVLREGDSLFYHTSSSILDILSSNIENKVVTAINGDICTIGLI